ncbi:hypothetical protein [Streptomyces sp. NPDC089919]|uniref:hypothetical protein n=1 Tax=Streptomyces sp. NPDC089919 TaxID=3155188 RepID=UPI0034490DE9
MKMRLVLAGAAVAASLGLCAATVPAAAAPAGGPLKLRVRCGDTADLVRAVRKANDRADGATITLAARCAYRFTGPYRDSGAALPPVTGKVTLAGDHSTLIRSVEDERFRLLDVRRRAQLVLQGVTVTGGDVRGDGGGIRTAGTLRLEHSTVAGNRAGGNGGGIANLGGSVALSDSAVRTNTASGPRERGDQGRDEHGGDGRDEDRGDGPGEDEGRGEDGPEDGADQGGPDAGADDGGADDGEAARALAGGGPAGGGGVYNDPAGTVTLFRTTVAGNTAERDGGGILNRGSLLVRNSRLEHNEARTGHGGGLDNHGTASVNGTVLSENWAGHDGGGARNAGRSVLETGGSDFLRNRAGRDGGGVSNAGRATLEQAKVLANQAGRDGGGLSNRVSPGDGVAELRVKHSEVRDNRAAGRGGGVDNRFGTTAELTRTRVSGNLPTNCAGPVAGCSAH